MTMANVIRQYGRPTLVLSHNKTLAAQLYGELKSFFPHNAVEYFISYYDYYQPEAYVPTTDTYIEKDASINEDIDRLRLRATSSPHGARGRHHRRDRVARSTASAIRVQYREQMVTLDEGAEDPARRHPAVAGEDPVHRATTSRSSAARSACAATRSRSSRRTRSRACASSCGATRSSASRKINPLTGETIADARAGGDLSGEALRHAAPDARARGRS